MILCLNLDLSTITSTKLLFSRAIVTLFCQQISDDIDTLYQPNNKVLADFVERAKPFLER